jgi:restriction system protein
MLPRLQRLFALSDEEMLKELPKGRTTVIASNTHWARTYMAKAGLVRSVKRGHFEITERGRAILAERLDRIDGKTLRRFPEFTEWLSRSSGGRSADPVEDAPVLRASRETDDATPLQRILAARQELDAVLADDLLERLLAGSPRFFEEAVKRLLSPA